MPVSNIFYLSFPFKDEKTKPSDKSCGIHLVAKIPLNVGLVVTLRLIQDQYFSKIDFIRPSLPRCGFRFNSNKVEQITYAVIGCIKVYNICNETKHGIHSRIFFLAYKSTEKDTSINKYL